MNFKKQQLKGVEIHGAPQVGTRTVNILMGEHANEFVRGDIMDANAVLLAFDELKGNVDTNHDTLEELVDEIHTNTNDIEVERNRAIDKENSITDKIDNLKYIPYVSKYDVLSNSGNFTRYKLGATLFIISTLPDSDDPRTEIDRGSALFISPREKKRVTIDYNSVTVGGSNNIKFTSAGIRKYTDVTVPAGSSTEAFSTDGGVIDTTAFALKSELDSYAKKTDIPEVNTSDFVSKTTTDNQSIKSGLNVSNSLNVVDGNNESLIDLSANDLTHDNKNFESSIRLIGKFDGIVDGLLTPNEGGCMISMVAGDQRNPYIIISTGTQGAYQGEDLIKITKSGISQKKHMYDEDTEYYFAANGTVNNIYSTDNKDIYRRFDDIDTSVNNEGVFVSSWNNLTYKTEGVRIKNSGISITNGSLNEVFAADGSIADLTQYVLKSIYDEKIAALESRIAVLESNHTA